MAHRNSLLMMAQGVAHPPSNGSQTMASPASSSSSAPLPLPSPSPSPAPPLTEHDQRTLQMRFREPARPELDAAVAETVDRFVAEHDANASAEASRIPDASAVRSMVQRRSQEQKIRRDLDGLAPNPDYLLPVDAAPAAAAVAASNEQSVPSRNTVVTIPKANKAFLRVDTGPRTMSVPSSLTFLVPERCLAQDATHFLDPRTKQVVQLTADRRQILLVSLVERRQKEPESLAAMPLKEQFDQTCTVGRQRDILQSAIFEQNVGWFTSAECGMALLNLVRHYPPLGLIPTTFKNRLLATTDAAASSTLTENDLKLQFDMRSCEFWNVLLNHWTLLVQPRETQLKEYAALLAQVLMDSPEEVAPMEVIC